MMASYVNLTGASVPLYPVSYFQGQMYFVNKSYKHVRQILCEIAPLAIVDNIGFKLTNFVQLSAENQKRWTPPSLLITEMILIC